MSDIVNKLWGFCHTLRHDGIGYLDYIEQLTFLLFIKMADERGIDLSRMKLRSDLQPVTRDSVPRNSVTCDPVTPPKAVDCSWPALSKAAGTGLIDHYVDVIRTLGKQPGILGDIFSGGQSRFRSPVNLKKLISLIDETEWTTLGVDVKAQAFEGLLEKAADEGKKGAGQYFTPRLLIESLVRCVKPDPRKHKEFAICDPACGTGGFLMCAYEWLMTQTKEGALDRDLAKRVREQTYFGQDIDPAPRRLALMNLYLHNLTPHIKLGDSIYEDPDSRRFDVVMTNPPFGTRGANQAPTRDDFTIATSNKQLNFVQHIMTVLKPGGRAAVVLPDNCLFEDQAGEVFKILTEECDLHTVVRLPNGTFSPYSPGTKTNVVFFTKGFPTDNTWIYDCRTNVPHITKKERPLTEGQFAEFEKCFGDDPLGRAKRREKDSREDRWHCFNIEQVKERGYKLDGLKWLKDDSLEDASDLPEPDALATDAIEELTAAVKGLNAIIKSLENGT